MKEAPNMEFLKYCPSSESPRLLASHVKCGNPAALSLCVADINRVLGQSCPSKNIAHKHKSYEQGGQKHTEAERLWVTTRDHT